MTKKVKTNRPIELVKYLVDTKTKFTMDPGVFNSWEFTIPLNISPPSELLDLPYHQEGRHVSISETSDGGMYLDLLSTGRQVLKAGRVSLETLKILLADFVEDGWITLSQTLTYQDAVYKCDDYICFLLWKNGCAQLKRMV